MATSRRKKSDSFQKDLEIGLAPLSTNREDDSEIENEAVVTEVEKIPLTKVFEANPNTSGSNRLGKIIMVAIVLVVLVDIYIYATPKDEQAAHLKQLNERMEKFADSIRGQKEAIEEEIGEETKRLAEDKKSLNDFLPIVAKSHHEGEIINLKNEHQNSIDGLKSQHEEEMSAIKAEYDKLSKEKQEAVNKLQEQIKNHEKTLGNLQEKGASLKFDASKFCPECSFNYAGLKTTCGARKDYLVNVHKDNEEDALQAVVTWDSGCKKD
mmetsp:Transcript_1054/g.1538  ORF Transcript_1054/g.1538 Transcript_1054/m.1538 type:complete len:267 (+) Transcript_1054:63-863(+)